MIPAAGGTGNHGEGQGMEGQDVRCRWRPVTVTVALMAALLLLAPGAGASTSTVKPVKIRPETLRLATATVPYAQSLGATGGTAPYTFTLQSGSLPGGMTLSPSGELAGTPTAAG